MYLHSHTHTRTHTESILVREEKSLFTDSHMIWTCERALILPPSGLLLPLRSLQPRRDPSYYDGRPGYFNARGKKGCALYHCITCITHTHKNTNICSNQMANNFISFWFPDASLVLQPVHAHAHCCFRSKKRNNRRQRRISKEISKEDVSLKFDQGQTRPRWDSVPTLSLTKLPSDWNSARLPTAPPEQLTASCFLPYITALSNTTNPVLSGGSTPFNGVLFWCEFQSIKQTVGSLHFHHLFVRRYSKTHLISSQVPSLNKTFFLVKTHYFIASK